MISNEYSIIFIFLIISCILSFLLFYIAYNLSMKNKTDKEKISVYECGFNPFHTPGNPISIKFFMIGILFLIFDLEIALLFPWASYSTIIPFKGQIFMLVFIIALVAGLIYEWKKGGLEWE